MTDEMEEKTPGGNTPPANFGAGAPTTDPSSSLAPGQPGPSDPDGDTIPYFCDEAALTAMPDAWDQFVVVPSPDELEVEAIKDLEARWLRFKRPAPLDTLNNYSQSLLTPELFKSKTYWGMRAILEINQDTFKTVLESDWWKEEPQFHTFVIDSLQRSTEQAMSDLHLTVDRLEAEVERRKPPEQRTKARRPFCPPSFP
ncbi:MAG: hypothetical protein GY696_02110 [Gammaproteobacteria bacterium]|nr:hypothetical protein [Gammaproteobacteria bacterium]